jgi:hypothetical protein
LKAGLPIESLFKSVTEDDCVTEKKLSIDLQNNNKCNNCFESITLIRPYYNKKNILILLVHTKNIHLNLAHLKQRFNRGGFFFL